MADEIWCLDTGVFVKYLVAEEPTELIEAAVQVVHSALASGRIVAPAFAWAEVGSVLRKKARLGFIQPDEGNDLWKFFTQLPISYLDSPDIRARAWAIATQFHLSALYDVSYLACTELTVATPTATRYFWTTDVRFIRSLGANPPHYVRQLGVDSVTAD